MMRLPWRRAPRRTHHNTWLILIAAFKLAQAVIFFAIGVGAMRLVGKDVGDLVQQLADNLHFNPETHIVRFLLERADLIDDHLLRRIGAAVFIYAGLDTLEGIGLYLEKTWAEYLTLFITGSFLPLEIREVIIRVTWVRMGLLAVNFLVFLYLFKLVLERRKSRQGQIAGE
jgi:uncharacterized membrane protein (DUF2068 family)